MEATNLSVVCCALTCASSVHFLTIFIKRISRQDFPSLLFSFCTLLTWSSSGQSNIHSGIEILFIVSLLDCFRFTHSENLCLGSFHGWFLVCCVSLEMCVSGILDERGFYGDIRIFRTDNSRPRAPSLSPITGQGSTEFGEKSWKMYRLSSIFWHSFCLL